MCLKQILGFVSAGLERSSALLLSASRGPRWPGGGARLSHGDGQSEVKKIHRGLNSGGLSHISSAGDTHRDVLMILLERY